MMYWPYTLAQAIMVAQHWLTEDNDTHAIAFVFRSDDNKEGYVGYTPVDRESYHRFCAEYGPSACKVVLMPNCTEYAEGFTERP